MATLGNSTATQLSVLRSLISSGTLSVSGTSTFTGKTTHNGGIGTTTLSVSGTSTFTGKTTHNGGIGTTTLAASNKATFTGGVHINTSTDAYPLVIARGGSETEALKISVNDSIATFRYENDEKSNQFKFILVNTDTENGTNQPNESVATISGGASGSIIAATSFSGALSGNATSATKLATKRTLWGQDFDGTSNVSGAMSSVGNISSTGNYTSTASDASGRQVVVTNSNGSVGVYTATNRGLYDFTTDKWIVATNGTNSWLSDGNVGIGTTSPSAKLHVSGGLMRVTNNSNSLDIGSRNASYCHFESSSDIPFYFNRLIYGAGGFKVYGTSYALATDGTLTASSGNFEKAITLTGTTAANARLAFSRTGENTYNYITWPGNSGGSCLLSFGYSNSSAASYYHMSNSAFYPASNNTKTLGTSTNTWSNVYATTFTGNLSGNASTATNSTKFNGLEYYRYMQTLSDASSDVNSNIAGNTHRPYIVRLGGSSQTNYPAVDTSGYGNIVHFTGSGSDTAFELFSGYTTLNNLLYRCGTWKSDGTGTINTAAWKTILHSGNYSSYALPIGGGTCTGSITATAFYESSDERLKDFEDDITVDIDKLKSIKKAYFRWKDNPDRLQLGVSAQSVKAVYPEIVSEDEDGMLTVAYDKLSVIALAAVDELNDTVKKLEDRLNKLEQMILKGDS